MLVATRDPPLHSGADDNSRTPREASPRFAGLMTALQIAGSLLALPVGLVSGYSVYHANFSAEARCQNLRANIVSTLDKSADASTLRMLVRRDVAAFEASCGTFDPDAVAAFRSLFATRTEQAKAPAVAPPAPVAHEGPATKPEPRPPVAKAKPAVAESALVQRPATVSDAAWLAAVRQALVHSPEQKPLPAAPVAESKPPIQVLGRSVSGGSGENLKPVTAPVAAAPALPAATPVPAVPAASAAPADVGHPVPPAPIVAPSPPAAVAVNTAEHSGNAGWFARIPLLGRAFGSNQDSH